MTRYPLYRMLGERLGWSWQVRKISPHRDCFFTVRGFPLWSMFVLFLYPFVLHVTFYAPYYRPFNTNIHAPGGIRTHDASKRAAVDLCLRPCGHWDRRDSISGPSSPLRVAIPTTLSRPTKIKRVEKLQVRVTSQRVGGTLIIGGYKTEGISCLISVVVWATSSSKSYEASNI
jgi:hypothetical protein